jgi:Spy/CpxP family protein refolding chaperone
MTQLLRVVMVTLTVAALAALAPLAVAQEAKAEPKKVETPPRGGVGYGYGLPGYYMLQMEYVQKELELVPEQKRKLEEIAKSYMEARQQTARVDWAKIRELPAEEQKKKHAEMQQAYTKAAEDAKKQVEAVLLPHQLQTLKRIESRQRAAMMLYIPAVLEKINVTEGQKKRMQQVRDEIQRKIQQLQQETIDKVFEVLTPEQRKQLEEMGTTGYPAWRAPGGKQ